MLCVQALGAWRPPWLSDQERFPHSVSLGGGTVGQRPSSSPGEDYERLWRKGDSVLGFWSFNLS